MGGFYIVILFFVIVGGCTLIGKILGNFLFPKGRSSDYIDRSTNVVHHHHYHDNRSIHVDGKEFKNLK